MIKNVLFDLDGTLLPMDQDEFTGGYFKFLAKKAAPYGYEPQKLVASVWDGTKHMVMNDGSRTNEEAFWKRFAEIYGEEHLAEKAVFDDFYANEFNLAKDLCGFAPRAGELVKGLREKGVRVILATNPLFPMTGQHNRIRWAGMDPEDFEFISSYENSHYCKPNPMYYRELCDKLGLDPEECLMIGNDTAEDTVAEQLGMKVYLVTDYLLNRDGRDISPWPHGTFDEMIDYVEGALAE